MLYWSSPEKLIFLVFTMSGLLITTISFSVLVSMIENTFIVVVDLLQEYRCCTIFAFILYIYIFYVIIHFSLKITIFPR